MIKHGFLNEFQKNLEKDISLEGMSQYLLLISAEDIIFSFDLMMINLLNSTYHELDPFTYSEAMNEALVLLKNNTDSKLVDIELYEGEIRVRPLIINRTGSQHSFLLLAKTTSEFILRPIYDKYFKHIHISKLTYDIFLNPNVSGLLTTDSNFLVYDDSNELSLKVLSEFTRMFHLKKLIPKSKLPDYIIKEVAERETIVDFVSNDLNYTINTFKDIMVERFKIEIENKNMTVDSVVRNFKTMSVIGNVTAYNMVTMSNFKDSNKPEYSVGLTYVFDSNLAKN